LLLSYSLFKALFVVVSCPGRRPWLLFVVIVFIVEFVVLLTRNLTNVFPIQYPVEPHSIHKGPTPTKITGKKSTDRPRSQVVDLIHPSSIGTNMITSCNVVV
jgi:hypothetical protein